MAAAKCPNFGQFKYEKSFFFNKGIGLLPIILGAGFGAILPRIISNVLIIAGVLASIYSLFIWKPKTEYWQCENCKFPQHHTRG